MPNGFEGPGPYDMPPLPPYGPYGGYHPIWTPFDILLGLANTAGAVLATATQGVARTIDTAGRDITSAPSSPPSTEIQREK